MTEETWVNPHYRRMWKRVCAELDNGMDVYKFANIVRSELEGSSMPPADGVTIPRELAERCEVAFLRLLAFTHVTEYQDGLTADAAAIRAALL